MKTEIIEIKPGIIGEKKTDLQRAAEIIRAGGLVVFPTETVYGLGGDATNPESARKIYEAKGRPGDNPLIIHISAPSDAEKYTYTNELYYKLAEKFMPGPITVILKSKDSVAAPTRAGLPTVAVRCPSNLIANEFIRLCGVAVAAPSANLSGSPSPTCGRHVIDDMDGRVDMIIDGGSSDIGVESTIVKIEDNGTLTLLRPGAITVEDLEETGAEVHVANAVLHSMKEGEVVLSPGMKYKHYAPKAPLFLLDGTAEARAEYIRKNNENTVVLCFREEVGIYKEFIDEKNIFDIGAIGDTGTEAHLLFYYLREADKLCPDRIFAPLPPEIGMGMALYNRMIRAASHRIIKV